jgi:uncharacterized protein (DUF1015 family)
MVKIAPISPFLPTNPTDFCTNPYDIIGKEEEKELKKNPNSLIHVILPEGDGEEFYFNAKKGLEHLKSSGSIVQTKAPSIYVYRQESPEFSQQGFILGVSLQDYEEGNIVKHEHTRAKPLADRTKHIATTNAATGLVWNVFKADREINAIFEQIKEQEPKFDFHKYGYRHLLWEESNPEIISKLQTLFEEKKIYIADGHHRAASANEYRKKTLSEGADPNAEGHWQNLLAYLASDDQIWILPYNRIIRKLPMSESEFIAKLGEVYTVSKVEEAFNPDHQHQVAMCIKGTWYNLEVKQPNFANKRDALDVAILQDKVLDPILGIKDIRKSDNIFFEGNVKYFKNPSLMEKEFIHEKGNDVFINLYSVDIHDIEAIGEAGGVMPPKSTWFEPKVLSGLTILNLKE